MEITIPEFYEGKKIFMTGATGFIGKLLIEKLLRSCNIGKLYILIRSKKGQNVDDRLQELYKNKIFDTLRKEKEGEFHKKVVALTGNVNELNLGLSDDDRRTIIEEISIIIHSAASVRFDDPLKHSILNNLKSAREIAKLALEVKNLLILVHFSTAFVNCDRHVVEEKLYPPKYDWRKMIEIAERGNDHVMNLLTKKVLDGLPNTYTFTKGLAEHCIKDICDGKVPVLIVRPSIVIATLREPISGWSDNFNGPGSLTLLYFTGLLRVIYVTDNVRCDYIPADIVVKSTLVSIFNAVCSKMRHLDVIHICSYKIEWLRQPPKDLPKYKKLTKVIPLNKVIWPVGVHVTTHKTDWYIRTLLFQVLPAFFLDFLIEKSGNKPIIMNIQRKIFVSQVYFKYFIHKEWCFLNNKILQQLKIIHEKDKTDWDYDFYSMDDIMFAQNFLFTSRRYLLDETDELIPKAFTHYKRLLRVQKLVTLIFYGILIWVYLKIVNLVLA